MRLAPDGIWADLRIRRCLRTSPIHRSPEPTPAQRLARTRRRQPKYISLISTIFVSLLSCEAEQSSPSYERETGDVLTTTDIQQTIDLSDTSTVAWPDTHDVQSIALDADARIPNVTDARVMDDAQEHDGLQPNASNCTESPCKNGGTCEEEARGYTCTCLAGFQGEHCETDIDECADEPCLNGGTCVDEVNDYSCTCLPGFQGENCGEAPLPDYICGDDGQYLAHPIGDWDVCVAVELSSLHPELHAQVIELLAADLAKVETLLPIDAILHLQTVHIWVEYDEPAFPGGVYHPSAGWLTNNGYPAYWAKGMQIGNATNYLSWTDIQPALVLHELSHAWHHQVVGYGNAAIQAAYDTAVQSGIYQNVPYAGGGNQLAYAMTNKQEYFAELTEAYFWENDFYPFTKSELITFDPTGYEAVEDAWLDSN